MMTSEPLENKIPKANAMEYYAVDEHGNSLYWPYLLSTISEYQEPWQLLDLDRLAKAVARHETASCTKGYGKEYNNCHGIKNGNTAPCPKIGRNRMCIYSDPKDSYDAFKKIWSTHYKTFPTLRMAEIYSGKDQSVDWLNNVTKFYNE